MQWREGCAKGVSGPGALDQRCHCSEPPDEKKEHRRPREHDTDTNAASDISDNTCRRPRDLECNFSPPIVSQ